MPTQITTLGIELKKVCWSPFLSLLGMVVLYFLGAFIVYAASDFLAWWEGYQSALVEMGYKL